MKSIIRLLTMQGSSNAEAIFKALLAAGIVTSDLTAHNVVALLVGVSAPPFANLPDYVLSRMTAANDEGDTFGEVFKTALGIPAHLLKVASVSINQNQPWTRISCLGGEVIEFETDNRPAAIRTDVVFSGGLIHALNLKLNAKTETGWRA